MKEPAPGTWKEAWRLFREANVSAYAAQAAFFVLLSLVPFSVLLSAVLQYFPWDVEGSEGYLPDVLQSVARELLLSEAPSAALMSLSAAAALWSASRGIVALTRGLNKMCGVTETRGWFRLRIFALIETLILVLALTCAFGGAMWGEKLLQWLGVSGFAATALRTGTETLILSGFFLFFYTVLPDRSVSPSSQLSGAAGAAAGWIICTELFSFYIERLTDFPHIYGALSNVAMLMLWIYLCLYLLFLGALFNRLPSA